MRLIGELSEESLAKRFAAYMMTENISPKIEERDGVWEVWVKEEDEQERALEEFNRFQIDPDNSRYQGVLEKAAEIAREEEKKRRQFQKNVVQISRKGGVARRTPLTILLIVLCCVVALLTNFGYADMGKNDTLQALSFTSIAPPEAELVLQKYDNDIENSNVRLASIKRGEVWRLITPIFIHFGSMHILFNMLWLFQFGRMIEIRYGMFWMAVLVVVVALISNLFQCLVPEKVGGSVPGMANGHLIMALGGMSGVVYGLFGFIWVKSLVDPASGFRLQQSTIIILVAWLFVGSFFMGNIANWAHGAGLAMGMIAGYLPLNIGDSPATRT